MGDNEAVLSTLRTVEELPESLYDELVRSVRGNVVRRGSEQFKISTTLFNGHIIPLARAVVLPVDAQDVSSAIQFCSKHKLSPSVKAGGYGTGGWAIAGDIVVDLSALKYTDIECPAHDGTFVRLATITDDTPKDKGKGIYAPSTVGTIPISGEYTTVLGGVKRQRSPDDDEQQGSRLVADFLRGPDMPTQWTDRDLPSPSLRRRVEPAWPGGSFPIAQEPSLSGMNMQYTSCGSSHGSSSGSANGTRSSSIGGNGNGDAEAALSTPPTSPEDKIDSENGRGDQTNGVVIMSGTTSGTPMDEDRRIISSSNSTPEHNVDNRSGPPTSASSNDRRQTAPAPNYDGSTAIASSSSSGDPFGYLAEPKVPYPQTTYRSHRQVPAPVPGPSRVTIPPPSSSTVYLNENVHSGTMSNGPPTSLLPSTITAVHPHAFVTVGAGVNQKDIDLFTFGNPLPAKDFSGNPCTVPYHVPLAAHPVGSSVMLLTGFGFLSRLHGLSIDALVEVEMVLADGRIVYVSENEHPDLWWAIRGAGPAFGVVTRYKVKAYPVPVVFAGNLIYKFRPATAASLVKHFRDCVKGAPRELYANVLFTAGPADKDSVIVVQICYVGSREKGHDFLEAISSWDGERCLLNEVDEKTFLHQQDSVAQILRGKAGRQWYIRSALITSLPDDIIHATVNKFADTPVGCTWLVELAGGAVVDFDNSCLPLSQRKANFTIAAFHQWDIGVVDDRCKSSAEEWINQTLAPVSTGGPYPSFLGRNERPSRVMGSYGENWSRLCEVKRKYDPTGLFKNTFWPLDIHGEPIDACTHEPPSPSP
ncbi:hypothetical protein BD410DRAFT_794846 [Rickenella mellea]|uniref:FAD-binding PCMH-type domain-containing protein n=1 Tax=Rickenella mellea TaxID=50990 RepID=A0A4Y7PQY7_9AGAM|nr:hypothetical protein BD410DRAFT_794846 [Rickenella mellea]